MLTRPLQRRFPFVGTLLQDVQDGCSSSSDEDASSPSTIARAAYLAKVMVTGPVALLDRDPVMLQLQQPHACW